MANALTFSVFMNDRQASRALDGLASKSEKTGRRISGSFGKLGASLTGAFVGVAGVRVFKTFIDEAEEARKIGRLTAQVIKTTGKAAHVTAGQVSELAEAVSNKTGVDDEAIQSGQNLLLTFTNIRNEVGKGNKIFDRATETIVDMSVALDQDFKSSAIQLGKALNDPIKGVTALQRVGVSFTKQQKEQIKTLVESGRTLDAQKIILAELGREFGGAAEAAASPMDKLRVSVGNLGEDVGTLLLPAVDDFASFMNSEGVPAIKGFISGFQDGTGAGGKFADAVGEVGDGLESAWKVGKPLLSFIADHPKLFTEIAIGAGGFAAAMKVLGTVKKLPGLGSLVDKATPLPVFVVNNGVGLPGGKDLPGKGKTPIAPVAARGVTLGIASVLLTSGDGGPKSDVQKANRELLLALDRLTDSKSKYDDARGALLLKAAGVNFDSSDAGNRNRKAQQDLLATYDLLVKYGKKTDDVGDKIAELAKDPRVAAALKERAAQADRNVRLISGGFLTLERQAKLSSDKAGLWLGNGIGSGAATALLKAERLDGKLTIIGQKKVAPKVDVRNLDSSISGLGNMSELITRLNGRSASVKVNVIASGSGVTVSGGSLMEIKLADGGLVRGAGTGRSDSIPARLSNGEFVVNAKQTARYREQLEAINAGQTPALASAGGGQTVYVTVAKNETAMAVPMALRQDAWLRGF